MILILFVFGDAIASVMFADDDKLYCSVILDNASISLSNIL